MRTTSFSMLLLLGTAAACGDSETCEAPAGCLRSAEVAGVCRCTDWEIVSVETIPIKYVVLSVDYGVLGSGTRIVYGHTLREDAPLPATSETGSVLRAVVREDGAQKVAALGWIDNGPDGGRLHPITGSLAVSWGYGGNESSGYSTTRTASEDVPSRANDMITIWMNPALSIATDSAGGKHANWGWTAVGDCFSPFACTGPSVTSLWVHEIDGTYPAWNQYVRPFLASLSDAERAEILRHDAFFDPPGRDPATFATDPRFELLGEARLSPDGSSFPTASWMPCTGVLDDASFAPLHETEVPFAWSGREVLLLQHGVLTWQPECRLQEAGLAMGTSTPGCEIVSPVYVDRMYGTLLFAPETITPGCTLE